MLRMTGCTHFNVYLSPGRQAQRKAKQALQARLPSSVTGKYRMVQIIEWTARYC